MPDSCREHAPVLIVGFSREKQALKKGYWAIKNHQAITKVGYTKFDLDQEQTPKLIVMIQS